MGFHELSIGAVSYNRRWHAASASLKNSVRSLYAAGAPFVADELTAADMPHVYKFTSTSDWGVAVSMQRASRTAYFATLEKGSERNRSNVGDSCVYNI